MLQLYARRTKRRNRNGAERIDGVHQTWFVKAPNESGMPAAATTFLQGALASRRPIRSANSFV